MLAHVCRMLKAVWYADSDDGNDALQARRLPDLARHADGALALVRIYGGSTSVATG
ncbi:hypothetical protein BO443_140098 [Burkholderia orbicola]